ncbi:glycosyltransferase [Sporanaerobacter acetigenes]|uniref:glycosyltransferase n=1 Tax=Sporanaerobacter acetigenes TaxID=165813 RepID=UPI0033280B5F
MTKMRVLHVMPDFELGGAQTMLENIVNELHKNPEINVKVCSFYNMKSPITERLEKSGVEIFYLGKHKGLDLSTYYKLVILLRKFKPNVIHTHRYSLRYIVPSLKMSGLKDVKIIHTLHSIAPMEVPKNLQKLQNKWFKSKMVIPVAISNGVKESMFDIYDLGKDDVPVIFNGVPLNKCVKKNNYEAYGVILHIGRFSDVKNHIELIKMFKELLKSNDKLKLNLIGSGELENEVKEYVAKLNISDNVNLLGAQESCFDYLNKSDIFILPSKYEGMPMTIIEAMGTGLPVVSRPMGGIPEMIEDGVSGYLCENVEDMKDVLLRLEGNDLERRRIGINALEKSKQFSSEIMTENYLKLYKGLYDKN